MGLDFVRSWKPEVEFSIRKDSMSAEWIFLLMLAAIILANVALEFIGPWRNPPIGEFLKVDDVKLHYIIRGNPNAPPLLMLHGNGTSLQDLVISGLVDAMSDHFRVICFD